MRSTPITILRLLVAAALLTGAAACSTAPPPDSLSFGGPCAPNLVFVSLKY